MGEWLTGVSQAVWGMPMVAILLCTHLWLTVRLRVVQRHTVRAVRMSVQKGDSPQGQISSFGALATALAATVGTGNIVGVSAAVALGGPGAVFWCCLTGVLGMATKYAEALLACAYRVCRGGKPEGGPMYVLERGMHSKALALAFAALGAVATFGTGCTVQSHAIAQSVQEQLGTAPLACGVVVTALSGVVIVLGNKGIAAVCEKLVPGMAALYVGGCALVLWQARAFIWPAACLIGREAFRLRAAAGGAVGGGLLLACRYGVSRGLLSNEAGLGTAPIAAARAGGGDPVRQALVAMTGGLWTSLLCGATGLAIVSGMLAQPAQFAGAAAEQLTQRAFSLIPAVGGPVLTLSLCIFAFTSILGWCYYGEVCVRYLFRGRGTGAYRFLFLSALLAGAALPMDTVWAFTDLMNALMALPNLIALWWMQGELCRLSVPLLRFRLTNRLE